MRNTYKVIKPKSLPLVMSGRDRDYINGNVKKITKRDVSCPILRNLVYASQQIVTFYLVHLCGMKFHRFLINTDPHFWDSQSVNWSPMIHGKTSDSDHTES